MPKENKILEPWYKVVTPRPEVRQGRSFNPDEFAIALEQVVSGTAPIDYLDPTQFFSRTVFTKALKEHISMVIRRMLGNTEDTSPVLTLVTQFGGGKTHTLTALYHIVKNPDISANDPGVRSILRSCGSSKLPNTKVAVLVGNAWDPTEGSETPWIDIARQLAGEEGIRCLGQKAKTSPPGTESLNRLFEIAGGRVLILFDEVLNLVNRHRDIADQFYSFIQNLTVALTGTTNSAAVISLPRSQVEMTEFDRVWQEKIFKVVRRVARELIANDESEIAEVVRRRLFEGFDAKTQSSIQASAKEYATWCYERRNQLPPEWTTIDSSISEVKIKESLQQRFESCYPFHPATLSVFQRKWQTLPQYQQTRGTLSMLAQWVSWAYRDGFESARPEAFISLGSAPLENDNFRATVLGQLGEHRLIHAIETDITGENSHARVLDSPTNGKLKGIHKRVALAILFESSGGMVDKVAHIPDIRFAIGEPGMDTTSIDNAILTLESKAFYLRKIGREGYRFGFKATLKKVVGDRRAALDEIDVKKTEKLAIKKEFERNPSLPLLFFPKNGSEVPNTPKLTAIICEPDISFSEETIENLAQWTIERNKGEARFYPGGLIWCFKRNDYQLQEKVEIALAWKQVKEEIERGILGDDFEPLERQEINSSVRDAEDLVREEVWAAYRFIAIYEPNDKKLLHTIDLGAGHASAGQTLTARIVSALKSEGYLNDSIGGGYVERNWPTALKDSGVWSLNGLRQSFLDGSLTRLVFPEETLKTAIPKFVERGEFGLASGQKHDGVYSRVWFKEYLPVEEITFDSNTFLLLKERATKLKTSVLQPNQDNIVEQSNSSFSLTPSQPLSDEKNKVEKEIQIGDSADSSKTLVNFTIQGSIPPEAWNKIGIGLIPTLKRGKQLTILANISVSTTSLDRENFERELRKHLGDLGSIGQWKIEVEGVNEC